MRRLLAVGVLVVVLAVAWAVVYQRRGGDLAGFLAGPVAESLAGLGLVTQSSAQAGAEGKAAPAPAAPARKLPVETAPVRVGESVSEINTVGSLQSDESVQISSEIAGRVAEISFSEGEQVTAGDLLVRLDSTLTEAEIADVRARLDLAEANYRRTNVLAQGGNATQRANDEAAAARATARAALALVEARYNKLFIRAPFSGMLGVRKVSVGAYLNPGAEIVNLEKIDRLKVDFKVPEIHLANVAVGQTIELSVDALPGRRFTGAIYAVDPMVDVNGRALNIRARLPNPDLLLRPGLFARIAVKGASLGESVFIPEEAIVPRGADAIVYRVVDGRARETVVRLGMRRGGEVEVVDGLDAAAVVVTAGQHRLRDGAQVETVVAAAGQT
ncbi:MAG: efflux RND transporter periplasmic adaptor subunit [Pseudochelatococcus sp.]|jgi:membrane fusion protein (multidrug efflux system)|uniref:efflux RND transporter periplasmic adaptor subunit n=1 Tax=Pseudochelatococcus sp. TaxID=2020869 RepID=UPI003D8ED32D